MPDNAGYMYVAYIAAAAILGGYVVSLVVRAGGMARRADAIDTVTRK